MKASVTKSKATATGGTRKLKLSKETLQDLTPSEKQKDVKGGVTQAAGCLEMPPGRRLGPVNYPTTIYGGT